MPYYRITITDIFGHVSQGVRNDPMDNIDAYYGKSRRKAEIALKNRFKDIDVVMLTTSSKEVQDYLEKQRNKVWENAEIKSKEEILSKKSGKEKGSDREIREKLLEELKNTSQNEMQQNPNKT